MKRLGLIGTGSMGRWHLERWQQLPVEIAGYYDVNPAAAQAMADQFGGTVYKTLTDST